jgi:hypothetical protein
MDFKLMFSLAISLILLCCNYSPVSSDPPHPMDGLKHEGYWFYVDESPTHVIMKGLWWSQEFFKYEETGDTLAISTQRGTRGWELLSAGINGNEPFFSSKNGNCWTTWTAAHEGDEWKCFSGIRRNKAI